MIKSIVGTISTLLDRVIPDKNAREVAEHNLVMLEQNGDLQLLVGQLEVNKVEAGHPSIFVAGWRPAVGWACVATLVINYPMLMLANAIAGFASPGHVPVVLMEDTTAILGLLGTMLGMGGLRTWEKHKRVARDRIKE